MDLEVGKLNLMFGGQFGSEGKGLLAEYIGMTNHIDIAVSNASANAGHTFYWRGEKCVAKFLPVSGIINKRSTIYLTGAIIDPVKLLKEIEEFGCEGRVIIHPRCAIITQEDVDSERDVDSPVTKIASTQSGVGAALARKIQRKAELADQTESIQHLVNSDFNLQWHLDHGCTALMEVPQGNDLSISGRFYPHCTSRDISVPAALNDAQLHPFYLGKVVVCLRTFPIRVGDIVKDSEVLGKAGQFFPDSEEVTWEWLEVEPEVTTVTGRVRRVATFSMEQYKEMLNYFRPDYVFLNFVNYLSREKQRELLEDLPEVTHVGTGPLVSDVHLNHAAVS